MASKVSIDNNGPEGDGGVVREPSGCTCPNWDELPQFDMDGSRFHCEPCAFCQEEASHGPCLCAGCGRPWDGLDVTRNNNLCDKCNASHQGRRA